MSAPTITRQAFLLALPEAILAQAAVEPAARGKLLIVAAHPDDEYAIAATTYRLTRELGWKADHVVITNGEGGYRYAALAESIYGVPLTDEGEGRSRLPAIRKRETIAAGKVLGVRRHYFLEQRDSGFGSDASQAATGNWDRQHIAGFLDDLLARERYDAVFTLLPTADTHAHHRAATLLALEAVVRMPEDLRPLTFGAAPAPAAGVAPRFDGIAGQPLTRTVFDAPALAFDRRAPFGQHAALSYQIVVNWMVAEHKSQGLFQGDPAKHQLEQLWLFDTGGVQVGRRLRSLAERLAPASDHVAEAVQP